MQYKRTLARILIVSLLIIISLAGVPFGQLAEIDALAQTSVVNRKLSYELRNFATDSTATRVPVIIRTSINADRRLLSSLTGLGIDVRRSYSRINLLAARVPAKMLKLVAARFDVEYISFDRMTQPAGHLETTTGADQARGYGTVATGPINGSGIAVAVIDSGIDSTHHAFHSATSTTRVIANVDFTGEGRTDDPYGHGTHVAAMAAGNNHMAQGAYTGAAPAANIINVRVLDSQGRGTASNAIAGIDWCIENKIAYNIKVLNLSFGTVAVDSYVSDPLCLAVRRAVEAGLVVCVAAGNLGKDTLGNRVYGAIHSPGIEPSAITVGATNTFGSDSRADDGVASYSSRGPTRGFYTDQSGIRHYDNIIKPDLVAPGN